MSQLFAGGPEIGARSHPVEFLKIQRAMRVLNPGAAVIDRERPATVGKQSTVGAFDLGPDGAWSGQGEAGASLRVSYPPHSLRFPVSVE